MMRWLCLLLLAFTPSSLWAAVYTFPGNLPSGCSGSGPNYSCSTLTLAAGDEIIIQNPRPATITVGGILELGNDSRVNVGGVADDLTIVVGGRVRIGFRAKIHAHIRTENRMSIGAASQVQGNQYARGGLIIQANAVLRGCAETTQGRDKIFLYERARVDGACCRNPAGQCLPINNACYRNQSGYPISHGVCTAAEGAPSAFNAVDPGGPPVSGKIKTKRAGGPFALDLYALNAARTGVATGVNATVQVDLLANTTNVPLGADGCPTSAAATVPVGTVTLTAGQASITGVVVNEAWRNVRVRIRDTGGSGMTSCSTDAFAIVPAYLRAEARASSWETPGTTYSLNYRIADSAVVHKAGYPFTLQITGYTATGGLAGRYDGNPSVGQINCVLPDSSCRIGVLDVGTFSGSGSRRSDTATYSEVGTIEAHFVDTDFAAVDDGDGTAGDCTGRWVCTQSPVTIGRFVPAYFSITPNLTSFRPACGSFTYLGQPFALRTPLVLTVTARNRAGEVTQNYRGNLWKISANFITNQTWSSVQGEVQVVGGLPPAIVHELGSGMGTIQISAGVPPNSGLRLRRLPSLQAPFQATLNYAVRIGDADHVRSQPDPYQLTGIGFDDDNAATTRDGEMRFGRMRMLNAHGTELRPLPVPLRAEYWDGRGFVHNSEDRCTTLPPPTLQFYPSSELNQLSYGETTASLTSPLAGGDAQLRLSAPGLGNHGFVDVLPSVPDWLRYDWDGIDQANDGDRFDDAPRARAAFGQRNSGGRVLQRQEVY